MDTQSDLVKAIAVTNKAIGGGEIDKDVMRIYLVQLASYPLSAILAALHRCQRECRGQLALRDILERIDDGRPGPEEAWTICPRGEDESVVWNTEISEAFFETLTESRIAHRMAFLELYKKKVQQARQRGGALDWFLSAGNDPGQRARALLDAVDRCRLTAQYARRIDPTLPPMRGEQKQLPVARNMQGDEERISQLVGRVLKDV